MKTARELDDLRAKYEAKIAGMASEGEELRQTVAQLNKIVEELGSSRYPVPTAASILASDDFSLLKKQHIELENTVSMLQNQLALSHTESNEVRRLKDQRIRELEQLNQDLAKTAGGLELGLAKLGPQFAAPEPHAGTKQHENSPEVQKSANEAASDKNCDMNFSKQKIFDSLQKKRDDSPGSCAEYEELEVLKCFSNEQKLYLETILSKIQEEFQKEQELMVKNHRTQLDRLESRVQQLKANIALLEQDKNDALINEMRGVIVSLEEEN